MLVSRLICHDKNMTSSIREIERTGPDVVFGLQRAADTAGSRLSLDQADPSSIFPLRCHTPSRCSALLTRHADNRQKMRWIALQLSPDDTQPPTDENSEVLSLKKTRVEPRP
jgi:hypothetical protein